MTVVLSKEHLEILVQYFAAQGNVLLAYLYGSQARGDSNALSDVDLAILLNDNPDSQSCFETRLRVMGDISHILHIEDIDVAILNQASLALRYRVLRDGKLLYCADHDRMIAFRVRTINEYLDFKPILLRHERAIIEKARTGELFNGYNPHRGSLEHYRQSHKHVERTPTDNT